MKGENLAAGFWENVVLQLKIQLFPAPPREKQPGVVKPKGGKKQGAEDGDLESTRVEKYTPVTQEQLQPQRSRFPHMGNGCLYPHSLISFSSFNS